ncbi:MAG: DNA-directed RNA polymerase subunit omega [Acidobacteria bacterium]|nr:DNA-directed RNA polymerase subunit omega [Acidobacteriota bacterium]MBI3427526.1 DNA-directed RNA polymerase subunit omega [Acidobacteriota bacterium]
MSDNTENNNVTTIDSKYRKILIAAKRSKQLQKGARARVSVPNAKTTRVALAELERGLVDFELTEKVEK